VKDACPRCREPLKLIAVRPATALFKLRHLLVCSSADCAYTSGIDPKNVSARWHAAVNG
jgi:hypothetical protein